MLNLLMLQPSSFLRNPIRRVYPTNLGVRSVDAKS
jgi:hypothetical protein